MLQVSSPLIITSKEDIPGSYHSAERLESSAPAGCGQGALARLAREAAGTASGGMSCSRSARRLNSSTTVWLQSNSGFSLPPQRPVVSLTTM